MYFLNFSLLVTATSISCLLMAQTSATMIEFIPCSDHDDVGVVAFNLRCDDNALEGKDYRRLEEGHWFAPSYSCIIGRDDNAKITLAKDLLMIDNVCGNLEGASYRMKEFFRDSDRHIGHRANRCLFSVQDRFCWLESVCASLIFLRKRLFSLYMIPLHTHHHPFSIFFYP